MEFAIDLTSVATTIVAIVGALCARHLVPWLKSKFTVGELEKTLTIVGVAVEAAEQIATTMGWSGEEKFQYVVDYIENNGYTIDSETLKAYIESAVYELTNKLKS